MGSPTRAIGPSPPQIRLSIGVTGHREDHPLYAANRERIHATLKDVFDLIAASIAKCTPPFGQPFAPPRLHSMLADGADQRAAEEAVRRGWDLVAPLPFCAQLNRAINAAPSNAADARALLDGAALADVSAARLAEAITQLYAHARLFELADDDDELRAAFLAMHDAPNDVRLADAFKADSSLRVAQAARLVIEQSDVMIAIWDGARTSFVGGTGHSVAVALSLGANVIWIDPAAPEAWRLLTTPEALASLRTSADTTARADQIERLVRLALCGDKGAPRKMSEHTPSGDHHGASALGNQHWRARSNPLWHAYRRIETLFGGERGRNPWRSLRETYATPEQLAARADVLKATSDLPGGDQPFADRIKASVIARFAWADAISSHLSDTYRGGMIINFLLSAAAVIVGVAYLPLTEGTMKWPFALIELVLLSTILIVTYLGQRRRWHGRWFETRRVAEYLRHAPLLLALGAARAPGRWPRGAETSWPEHYARHALREAGLPRAIVTPAYLRHALTNLLDAHVTSQRDYHHAKAKKLATAHRNLDRLSEAMFKIAVVAVLIYLAMAVANALHLLDHKTVSSAGKLFTFLGVALPTLGGAIAGIRYFGDFERFAAISEITAGKLDAVHSRIQILLTAPDEAMDYGPVAELAHAADDIVVSEIENWQAVFAGKHITVPV